MQRRTTCYNDKRLARRLIFSLQAIHHLRHARYIIHQPNAMTGAPDFGTGDAGTEIHLRFIDFRQIVWIEAGIDDGFF
jgi:hypothetical protein